MKRKYILTGLVLLILMTFTSSALAGPVGYDLSWKTLNSSKSALADAGNAYSLSGTVGQAATTVSTGGGYSLSGGFWATSKIIRLYVPILTKN